MKRVLAVILFAASAFAQDISAPSAQAACGPLPAQFNVKIDATAPLPQVDPEKALVYVIEEQKLKVFRAVTTRLGVDGAWVGANRGNSHLSFQVDPGEHHLCTDWTSGYLPAGRLVSLNLFTAEAGKIYYFRVRTSGSPSPTGRTLDGAVIDLDLVNSDEGKLLVALSSTTTSQPRK